MNSGSEAVSSTNGQIPKRQRILDAALRLFAQQPYQAVTMDRVASAADVAKGTLYLYFQSKEDLYLGILSDGLETLSRMFFSGIDQNFDAKQRLRHAITSTMDFHAERRDLLRLIVTEEPRMAEARNRLIEDWRERGRQYFRELIEQGMKSAEFHPGDARLATLAIIGGFRQLLLNYGEGRDVAALGREYAELWVRALSAGAATYRKLAHAS